MKRINSLTTISVVGIILIFLLGAVGTSCKKPDPKTPDHPAVVDEKVALSIVGTVGDEVNLDELEITFEDIAVTIRDLRTLEETTANLDVNGKYETKIDKGNYTIFVEWSRGTVSLYGTKENFSVNENQTIEIPLTLMIAKPTGLIFKEIFFNGETNSGQMMHPDQYFVLFNNSDETVYADGVCFGLARHPNFADDDVLTEYLPDDIIACLVYAIPGSGTQYPVAPGEEIVIARTAINHNLTYPNAVDLSGAHFEAYDPDLPEGMTPDIDNPDVPNLIAYYSLFGQFMMHPRGYLPPFIFKVDGDMETFMNAQKVEFTDAQGEIEYAYKIPADIILDGIETTNEGDLKVKSLPNSVDKGFISVTGCHRQELIKRKEVEEDGRIRLVDTNNSSEDCIRVKGATNFPKR